MNIQTTRKIFYSIDDVKEPYQRIMYRIHRSGKRCQEIPELLSPIVNVMCASKTCHSPFVNGMLGKRGWLSLFGKEIRGNVASLSPIVKVMLRNRLPHSQLRNVMCGKIGSLSAIVNVMLGKLESLSTIAESDIRKDFVPLLWY